MSITKRITKGAPLSFTELDQNFTHLEQLVYNVKVYGATGDGSTDDTTFIQDALDAANDAGGGIVFFPLGNYKITSSLRYYKYLTIQGMGVGSKIVSYVADGFAFWNDYATDAGGPLGVRFTNFFIDGTNATLPAGTTGTAGGILLTGTAQGSVIEKMWIGNFTVQNMAGIYLHGGTYFLTIEDCNIYNNDMCLHFEGGVYKSTGQTTGAIHNITIRNCRINGDSTYTRRIGVNLDNAIGTRIVSCQIERFGLYGVDADADSKYNAVEGGWFEQNVEADIRDKGVKNYWAPQYTYRVPAHANNYSIWFNGASLSTVERTYFNSRSGGNDPVYFDASDRCKIKDCLSDVGDSDSLYAGTVGDNIIEWAANGSSNTGGGYRHRSDYPMGFPVGLWIGTEISLNEQDGVVRRTGEHLIIQQDGSNAYIGGGNLTKKQVSRSAAPANGSVSTFGNWANADFAWNTNPTLEGTAGNQYITLGWLNLAANTWVNVRCTTGT